eukprot:CAMPEP_0178510612 /NCGR_PEP_ID=MMETSP0696-20121128/21922_2 /TAXON_ID=265572 /ORGANISM="Extubocellulus spinifer, Strain CCMP396" /LENGTH=55 /DNA_ID=CAMNT_0020140331 /DNA_START=166 /DNA_END=330 /DNA_ORIENTATION=-
MREANRAVSDAADRAITDRPADGTDATSDDNDDNNGGDNGGDADASASTSNAVDA